MVEKDHWQVIEIDGVGIGELWFDVVDDGISRSEAEKRARTRPRLVAVPEPYEPKGDDREKMNEPGAVVDDFEREVNIK